MKNYYIDWNFVVKWVLIIILSVGTLAVIMSPVIAVLLVSLLY